MTRCPTPETATSCVVVYSLDGLLEVGLDDVQFAISHPTPVSSVEASGEGDSFVFPKFEIPVLSAGVEDILTESLREGKIFLQMWKKLLEHEDTVPLNVGTQYLRIQFTFKLYASRSFR